MNDIIDKRYFAKKKCWGDRQRYCYCHLRLCQSEVRPIFDYRIYDKQGDGKSKLDHVRDMLCLLYS